MRRSPKYTKRKSSSNSKVLLILLAIILIGSIVFYVKYGERDGPVSLYERGNDDEATSRDQEHGMTVEEPSASVFEEEQAMEDSSPDNELSADSEIISISAIESEDPVIEQYVNDDEEEPVSDQGEPASDQDEPVSDQGEVVDGQEELVAEQGEIAIEQDDPQDQTDSDTETFDANVFPAFHAIKTNDLVLLEQLILQDVDISANIDNSATSRDLIGFNAFHYAAYRLNIEAMSLLLQGRAGFEVDGFTAGAKAMPALHIVAWRGTRHPVKSLAAAEFLLSHDAAINSVSSDLKTPALIATETSNLALLSLFMIWNFDATYTVPIANYNILHVAMTPCHRPIIKALITYAPDIVRDVNMFNRMPIHEAAAKNCVDGLKELILVHKISKQTLSPPSSAQKSCCDSSDALFSAAPLHFAAKFKNFEAAEFLLLIQANFNCPDEREIIARDYAGSDGVPLYDYFSGRREWERRNPPNGKAEMLLRDLENRSPEFQLRMGVRYRNSFLHA